MVRTFDRQTYERIQEAWRSFGPEWTTVRHVAAERGFPLPPTGSRFDERDDPEPSQRSIVWRALDFRPAETVDIVRRSRSWSDAIGKIMNSEAGHREMATLHERNDEWDRKDETSAPEALRTVAQILDRIRDSAA